MVSSVQMVIKHIAAHPEEFRVVEETESEIVVLETEPRCVIDHLKHLSVLMGQEQIALVDFLANGILQSSELSYTIRVNLVVRPVFLRSGELIRADEIHTTVPQVVAIELLAILLVVSSELDNSIHGHAPL